MENKNRTIMQCKCSLKSLIGFEVSKKIAETLVNLPVTKEYNGNAIGNISSVDYESDSVEINLFTYALPEINIDEQGKASNFLSVSLSNETYAVEPTFKERF